MLGTTSGFAALFCGLKSALIGRTRRSLLALAFGAPLVGCIRRALPLPFLTITRGSLCRENRRLLLPVIAFYIGIIPANPGFVNGSFR